MCNKLAICLCLKKGIAYADIVSMNSEDTNKNSIIESLITYMRIGSLDSEGIILVQEGIIREVFGKLPEAALVQLGHRGDTSAPQIDDIEFRSWAVGQRNARGWGQSKLARHIGARAEQINRFEKGKKPLKAEYLTKIRNLFLGIAE